MAIAGSLIGGAIGAFGKKPKVPNLVEIDPTAVQAKTVTGNIQNFADIASLATQVNTFNQDQLDALIDRALPGARTQIQETLGSQLRGEIPQDVQSAIFRGVAERGGALTRGSGFEGNVTARDLGLTSLQITNQALSSAESWLSKATAPQFDVTSMFFTPQQRLGFEVQQQGAKFQRDLMASQVEAAPDPATAALGREIDRFFNTWAQVGMASLGSIGGGGGEALPMDPGVAANNQAFGIANPYSLGGYSFGGDSTSGSAMGAGLGGR